MKPKKRMYVDINVLQTLPSNCANRDDVGSPKSCIYGGVNRARISSQSWKRAVRRSFKEMLPEEDLGSLTKKSVRLLQQQLMADDPNLTEAKAEKEALDALKKAGLKIKNADTGTDALLLISKKQVEELAKLQLAGEKDAKVFKNALKEHPSIEMALFGRMVASDPSLNYDAACQVAHAITTHAVETEYDYYTAVDDLGDDDNAGAAHLGTTEFTSGTFYRYATINCMELFRSLGMDTPMAVRAFAEAFITSMPTGKQNSFANRTIPCSVYIAIREDQPVSLAPGFEKAVKTFDQGYEEPSQKAMVEYEKETLSFVKRPKLEITVGEGLSDLSDPVNLEAALDTLEKCVADFLGEEEA